MATKNVTVMFDRLRTVNKTGRGKVEIRVYLDRTARKYIVVGETTKNGWKTFKNSRDLLDQVAFYEEIVKAMKLLGEDMTIENFNYHVNGASEEVVDDPLQQSFIDYMKKELEREKIRYSTYRHKKHVIESVVEFGKIQTFADLTGANIRAYDRWLHETGDRTDVTIYGYHKRLKKYTRMLKMNEVIAHDPYEFCKISRGHSKIRTPLTEDELVRMRQLKLTGRLERARDLFVFAAYTGLAYIDTQLFNFDTMTEYIDGMYYIDSKRLKTGTEFFTPILQPAMDVLKKYKNKAPNISNQKANDYLHVIECQLGLKKHLTFHLARHTFATLALSHDVPVEEVARMLGHSDIRTTQIYAKILNTTVQRHARNLSMSIR